WEGMINTFINGYLWLLRRVMRVRGLVVASAVGVLVVVLVVFGLRLRREFFPEVDAGAFEIYVRAKTGTRIEETERRLIQVERFLKKKLGDDLEMQISELGLVPDWSAAYTPNAGPMDAVVKVQLKEDRHHSAQEYVEMLRDGFAADRQFEGLEFAFDAGGMIRGAMNESKATPINIRITGKKLAQAHRIAEAIQKEVVGIHGVVDCRILQRFDYPQYIITVNRAKASMLKLTQLEVMENLV